MRELLFVVLVAAMPLPLCATIAAAEEQSMEDADRVVAPPEERAAPKKLKGGFGPAAPRHWMLEQRPKVLRRRIIRKPSSPPPKD